MDVHASMRQGTDGRWSAATDAGPEPIRAEGASRDECLRELRNALAGSTETAEPEPITLIVEVLPRLAGVAEAASVMGWDKRRVITYIDRGRFPEPLQALAAGRVWLRSDVELYAREWHARNDARRAHRRASS